MAKAGRKPHKGLEILASQALAEVPEPPKGFTRDEAERYYTYAGELVERQILFPSDRYEVEQLVRLETEATKLLTEITQEGALCVDKNQDKRRSPAVMAYSNIRAEIGNIRKRLALGPVYRNKLPGREAGDAAKDGQRLAVEAEIRGKYTAKEAKLIIGALDSPMDIWNGDICKKPKLREAAREYMERLEIDEFDI